MRSESGLYCKLDNLSNLLKKGKRTGDHTGEKWVDRDLIRQRAGERDKDGRLGVTEGGVFRLWREFNGRTFGEMEDLVPLLDVGLEPFLAFGTIFWLVFRKFTGRLGNGERLRFEELGVLLLMYRIQLANEDTVFTTGMLHYYQSDTCRSRASSTALTLRWLKTMRKRGLIEQVPGLKEYRVNGEKKAKIALFRISGDGRRVIKSLMEAFKEVHKDIAWYVKNQEDRDYLARVMARFCLGVSYEELNAAGNEEELNELVKLTKEDLKKMGFHHNSKYLRDFDKLQGS